MRLRRSVRMEDRRRSLPPRLEQGSQMHVAEGSKLKLRHESGEGSENSKAPAGTDSPPSIAMPGDSRNSGATPPLMDSLEIPTSPPPQAPIQGPDRAAVGISKAAEVAVPAVDSQKSKQTQSPPEDYIDDRNLFTRPKEESTAFGRITDSHSPDGFSKNLDLLVAPAPTGSHNEGEHGSLSQSQMPRAKSRNSASIPWIGLPCRSCKSTKFSVCTDASAESVANRMHHQCNNCKQTLCRNARSYKQSGSEFKVGDRAKKGASQYTRRRTGLHGTIQAMRNLKSSQLAAPNSNVEAMPPPSNPNMKLMLPPLYPRKPNVHSPDSQDTSSAQTALPLRSSSCSDKLEGDHPPGESNLQLVVAPEPQARLPMKILEAMVPFPLSANLKESLSNQFVQGNQSEPLFANDGSSVKVLRDSSRGSLSSPLQENKKGSGERKVSDSGHHSSGLACPSCKSTNMRFCWPGLHYCNNCREYWNLSHLQHHEVQLPSKQFSEGKEKEKETPYEVADQISGEGSGDSSRGPCSLPLQVSNDGNGGSNQGPLNAPSCSRCKSTFTRLCTYGVFCDACGKHSPFAGTPDVEVRLHRAPNCWRCKSTFTRLCTYGVFCDTCGKHSPFAGTQDLEVSANPPVVHEVFEADSGSQKHQMSVPANPAALAMAMVHEVFDANSRSACREHQMQYLPPPRLAGRLVDPDGPDGNGSCGCGHSDGQTDPVPVAPVVTQTDPVARVPGVTEANQEARVPVVIQTDAVAMVPEDTQTAKRTRWQW